MTPLASIPSWLMRMIGADPASDASEVWFRFEGMDPGWALLIGTVFVAFIFLGYWKSHGDLSRSQRFGLALLRSLFLLLILFMLTKPVVRVIEHKETKGTLLVLQDVSASMQFKDLRNSKIDQERVRLIYGTQTDREINPMPSRSDLVAALATNEDLNLWPRIAVEANILVVPFGRKGGNPLRMGDPESDELTIEDAESLFADLEYSESSTAISDSLKDALEAAASEPLVGILLISDGANNTGEPMGSALNHLLGRNLPLFAYAVGVTSQRDLEIVSFTGPATVFLNETSVLNVRLRATGLTGETTQVRLVSDGETIDSKSVGFGENGEVNVSFSYVPKKRGSNYLTVVADELGEEVTVENNKASLDLVAKRRGVQVLIIEQEPRWDFRYLMDTLKRDNRIDVSAVMLDGDATLGSNPESGFLAELPSPEDLLEYMIVVVGDVDPERLSSEHMNALDQLARETGGGLVFLAGSNYNPLAYKGTPLQSLLPVQIDQIPENGEARYDDPVPLFLTFEGSRSPLLRLDPDAALSERIWREFPGVRWTANTGPAKPSARVLLEDPTPAKVANGESQPVLAHMSVGRGQVFYFGFDETWRWRSRIGEKHYLKIWGQVFLKLGVERLKGASDRVQLSTARNTYSEGESILIYGRIFDEGFQPLDAEEVAGTLSIEAAIDDERTEVENAITLKSRPGIPGDYEVKLLASTPGRYVLRTEIDPEASVTFNVDASNLEMRDPSLNLEGLMQLAGSERRIFREEDLDELPEALTSGSMPMIRDVRKYEPAFHPFIYVLLLVLPVAEWLSRRILKLK